MDNTINEFGEIEILVPHKSLSGEIKKLKRSIKKEWKKFRKLSLKKKFKLFLELIALIHKYGDAN